MTIGELFLSTPFDTVWPLLRRLYDVTPVQRDDYASAYAELCALAADATPQPYVVVLTDVTPEAAPLDRPRDIDVSCRATGGDGDGPVGNTYAMDFTPWRECVGYGLGDATADAETVSHVLWELTFSGYTAAEIDAKGAALRGMLDDLDAGTADVHGPYDTSDVLFDSMFGEWAQTADDDDVLAGGIGDGVLTMPWGELGDDYDDDRRTGEELYD